MKKNILAGLIALSLVSCKDAVEEEVPSARFVKTFTISEESGRTKRIFPGQAKAFETAELSFQVPGELIEFPVREGEDVIKGQVLARLDPVKFDLAIRKAQAIRDNAKIEFERASALLKKDFTPKSTYDLRLAELEVAESELGLAKDQLKDSILTAPFDGKVAKTYVENFQHVAAKAPILTLDQVNPIDVTVQLPEDVVATLEEGNVEKHYVTFSVIPNEKFVARYKESSTIADPTTQTYEVVMSLNNPEGFNILPGMTANVSVQFRGSDDRGYIVPFSTIIKAPDATTYVYVINPQTQEIHKKEVKLADREGDQVVVLEGLEDGDQIVSAGVDFLQEGEKVQVLPLGQSE